MKLLNHDKELFTQKVWEDIEEVNTNIVENYIEVARKEVIVRPKIDTYHSEIGGFGLKKINLADIANKPVSYGIVIKGKFEFVIFPHESNKDVPFGGDKKFTVYSKDDYYAQYEDYIDYCWGLWDMRKFSGVVYRHEFERAITPEESNTLKIIPDEYINREGERIQITDLKLLRNKRS